MQIFIYPKLYSHPGDPLSNLTVLIGNLPTDTTRESLLNWLSDVREEVTVTVQLNKHGVCRGYATVEVANDSIAEHILNHYDRTNFQGRTVFMHTEAAVIPVLTAFERIKSIFRRSEPKSSQTK